jgi:hypothetical protein
VRWYAAVGTGFYDRAADLLRDNRRSLMMKIMARRFEFWREQQRRLARELREAPSFLPRPTVPEPKLIM